MLAPGTLDLNTLRAAGVTTVTLDVAWSRLETGRGCFSRVYLAEVRHRYTEMRAAGLAVVLDAGLQYPPAWVFDLGGDTRFVNQYGEAWHGAVGADIPDPIFNLRVRDAQSRYLKSLGRLLQGVRLDAIRVGGLANDELHYPLKTYGGHTDCFWSFGKSARRTSPVPDYRPGGGSADDAHAYLDWYLGSINGYAAWLAGTYRAAFGDGPTLQLLMPSWGIRPGDRAAAEAGRLTGSTRGEQTGALNEGLAWEGLAARAATLPGRVDLYSTWMDAPDQGDDPVLESPLRYIVSLARPLDLPVAGENTGAGDVADMTLSVQRMHELGLTGLFWFDGAQLVDGQHADLADLAKAVAPG